MAKKKEDQELSVLSINTEQEDIDIFGDFFVEEQEQEIVYKLEELEDKPAATKVDMFNSFDHKGVQYKGAFDSILQKDYNYVTNMPPELAKKYSPIPLMKMLTSPSDNSMSEHDKRKRLMDINDWVNVDMFMLGSEHNELQHKLLCIGTMQTPSNKYHKYVKEHKTKIHSLIKSIYTHLNKNELEIIISGMNQETFIEFLQKRGYQDNEIKKLAKIWKQEIGR